MQKNLLSFIWVITIAFSSFIVSCSDNSNDNFICKVSVSHTEGGNAVITNYIETSVNVLIGNSITVVATPDYGYTFLGWYIGNNNTPISTKTALTFVTSKNISLVAKFGMYQVISISHTDGGSVSFKDSSSTSLSLLSGTEVTAIATPSNGYKFNGWFNGDTKICDNLEYTFIVSETATLIAKFELQSYYHNGHNYVDLGLPSGLKWATRNIGASSPEEYGEYYAWGETKEKENYSWQNYKWCNGDAYSMTKYSIHHIYGIIDNKIVLYPDDDVAHVKWGGNWRTPTKAEQCELYTECEWTWTTLNGFNGYRITGPNGNSIFLPAAGYSDGTNVKKRGLEGFYWASSLYDSNSLDAYYLFLSNDNYEWRNGHLRYSGLNVRPVFE